MLPSDELEVRKNRERCPYSGKTIRAKGVEIYGNSDNPEVDISRNIIHSEGMYMFPVTAVDRYIGNLVTVDSDRISLSKKARWDVLSQAFDLEELQIKCQGQSRANRQSFLIYEALVKDHIFVGEDQTQIRRKPKTNFFEYNGRTFDPQKLYMVPSNKKNSQAIIEYGPLYLDAPKFSDAYIKKLKVRVKTLRQQSMPQPRLEHSRPNFGGMSHCEFSPVDQAEIDNEFLIDLRRPHYVTHIGTAGSIPKVRIFPPRDKRVRTHQPCVYLIEKEDDLSWVSSYDLFFQHLETKQWVHVGTMPGNTGCASEQVNSLHKHFTCAHGLCTRLLKLVPTEFHGRPAVRVAVYGLNRLQQELKDGPETVRYTVYQPQPNKWRHDGTTGRAPDWFYRGVVTRAARRKAVRAAAREEAAGFLRARELQVGRGRGGQSQSRCSGDSDEDDSEERCFHSWRHNDGPRWSCATAQAARKRPPFNPISDVVCHRSEAAGELQVEDDSDSESAVCPSRRRLAEWCQWPGALPAANDDEAQAEQRLRLPVAWDKLPVRRPSLELEWQFVSTSDAENWECNTTESKDTDSESGGRSHAWSSWSWCSGDSESPSASGHMVQAASLGAGDSNMDCQWDAPAPANRDATARSETSESSHRFGADSDSGVGPWVVDPSPASSGSSRRDRDDASPGSLARWGTCDSDTNVRRELEALWRRAESGTETPQSRDSDWSQMSE